MFKHFITLEWKSFTRSAAFGTNLVLKIFRIISVLYFIALFTAAGFFLYSILQDGLRLDPLTVVNKFLIYYFVADLALRYLFQKMPVMNIRPLLLMPIKKNTIVRFTLGKTSVSVFNLLHAFFFIPFSVMLMVYDHSILHVLLWHLGIIGIIYGNNFINVLINNKDRVFYPVLAIVVGCGAAQYYKFFDVTNYTAPFFDGLYKTSYLFLLPIVAAVGLYYWAFKYFKSQLNLDEGLAKKSEIAKTENFNWLNQFGTLGTFLKNDLRMIKRNKRPRNTLFVSVFFIFYGLFFILRSFNNGDDPTIMVAFSIIISGGFLMNFGQFVPSWDSAYYQLMMSQNIQYKEYISSKWWLMVIATIISTVVASFYLYFGWKIYLLIVVGAIYNIGVNSHLTLLGGAFVKTPIDLTVAKKAYGEKQAFNMKAMLIGLPKLLVPMGLYFLGYFIYSPEIGCLLIAAAGILGFAFRDYVFTKIEVIYKTEKYATIAAYKQNN